MRKVAVILILILIIAGVSVGYYRWRAIREKKDIREEALLYFEEEDYRKSADLFEDARSRKTFFSEDLDRDITSYLAESYYLLEEYDKAANLYNRLINESPDKPEYYHLKGACLEDKGQYKEAVSCYRKGYDKSGDSSLLLKTCNVYIKNKDYKEALSCAEEGAEGDDRQEFRFMKIVIYEKSQDYQSAYKAAQEYVDLYPKDERGKKEYIFLSTRID